MRRKGKQSGRTGIEKSTTDKVQPFRVYFKGNIIKFVKTRKEAEQVLAKVEGK